jgi:hypothetical protein
MDIARAYDWLARDCIHAAEQTEDPRQREILLRLAVQWEAAAQKVRDERRPLARISMTFRERVQFWKAQAQLVRQPPVWWKRLIIKWMFGTDRFG